MRLRGRNCIVFSFQYIIIPMHAKESFFCAYFDIRKGCEFLNESKIDISQNDFEVYVNRCP